MSVSNRARRDNIENLLAFLLPKLNPQGGKGLGRAFILKAYSYESGISLRTLIEYVDVLAAAGLLKLQGTASWASLYLVDEAT